MNDPAPPAHPFAELLGFEVTARGDGRCITELELAPRHRNPHGIVHGAVLYALADTGMGGALTSVLDPGQLCSTVEIKIVYFRPALEGRLVCTTELVNRTRRTAALESSLRVGEKLLARAYGTFMILDAPS